MGESEKNVEFGSNVVQTARYTGFRSLLFRGLLDLVVSSVASLYFFVVGLLQMCTTWSPTGRYSTMGPYTANKLIELAMVARANTRRQLADHLVNERLVRVVRQDGEAAIRRSAVRVGDVVVLETDFRGEEIFADLVLLYSPTRDVYLETSALTGEKDAVRKKVVDGLHLDASMLSRNPVCGVVRATAPVPQIDRFGADICIGVERYRASADSLLPAGSVLLQGTNIYAVVVACGADCKINLNSSSAAAAAAGWRAAIASLESMMSPSVKDLLCNRVDRLTQATLVLFAALIFWCASGYVRTHSGDDEDDFVLDDARDAPTLAQVCIVYALLFNGLIAQTLHFLLSFARNWQAESMPADDVHNPAAYEQLALCDSIVFDKTGTLTSNRLVPKFFSVHRSSLYSLSNSSSTVTDDDDLLDDFDDDDDDDGDHAASSSLSSPAEHYCRRRSMRAMQWPDIDDALHDFMVALLLNNSVIRCGTDDAMASRVGANYMGVSADEVSLLETMLHSCKYSLVERRQEARDGEVAELTTSRQRDNEWAIVQRFAYSSSKGTMTVFARRVGGGGGGGGGGDDDESSSLLVVTKGSPSKVLPMLRASERREAEQRVLRLAEQGLRVLLVAWRRVDWNDDAQRMLERRRARGDKAALDMLLPRYEQEMTCLGATGTEDRLHPNLSASMNAFRAAAVRTIVCTGDLKQTALNIGVNCSILPSDSSNNGGDAESTCCLFDIDSRAPGDSRELETQVDAALAFAGDAGVLVGSHDLPALIDSATELSAKFARLVSDAAGVVVYRATPDDKLRLVRFLQRACKHIVCAVGDGANDVPMLKEAHVGVGIKSGENAHAAASSDVAINVVTELALRMFRQAPQNWHRNTHLAKFISSMKLSVVVSLLIFDVMNGYRGVSLFGGKMLLCFNMFTNWASAVFALTFRRVERGSLLDLARRHRRKSSPLSALSALTLFGWLARAAFDSALVYVACSIAYGGGGGIDDSIHFFSSPTTHFAFANFVLLVVAINVRVSLDTGSLFARRALQIHAPIHLSVLATIAAFFLFALVPRLDSLPPNFLLFIGTFVLAFIALDRLIKFCIDFAFNNKVKDD
jgi:magnesium-transporting ATPase (P-type)